MDVSVKAWANSFNIFCNKASDVNCCEEQRVSTSIQHVKGEVGGGGGEREEAHGFKIVVQQHRPDVEAVCQGL